MSQDQYRPLEFEYHVDSTNVDMFYCSSCRQYYTVRIDVKEAPKCTKCKVIK